MPTTITCPSGLSGVIRGMRSREERILADRQLMKNGGQMDRLLAACWEETHDAGPYTFAGDTVDWGLVLQGDRFFALLQLRALTYGPEYAFAVHCQNSACRARIEWELDLTALPVRPLLDESRAALVDGNRIATTIPGSGERVWFRLLTGADERRLHTLRRTAGDRPLTTLLAYRIVEIEGVEPRAKKEFLDDLPLGDACALLDRFDEADCGVETSIEIECPECFAQQALDLPFGPEFFLPRKTTKARRASG